MIETKDAQMVCGYCGKIFYGGVGLISDNFNGKMITGVCPDCGAINTKGYYFAPDTDKRQVK